MLKLKNINIKYENEIFVDQDIEIKNNCLTLIKGPSGSGKTTLLYRLGLLDSSGINEYIIDEQKIDLHNPKELSHIRRCQIGYVFQEYLLYDRFNVYENMRYFASLSGHDLSLEEAKKYLEDVHLDIPLDRKLNTLSGGQKQRLAIACALTKNPSILILDEPTSALDHKNMINIFQILKDLSQTKIVIMASHNAEAYDYCDEVIEVNNGEIKKIKSSLHDEEKIELHQFNQNINDIKSYLKKDDDRSKKQKILITIVHMIVFMLVIVTIQITTYYMEESQNVISLDQPAQIYVEDFDEKDLNALDKIPSYPYYENKVMIRGTTMDVIPLYKENSLDDKLWTIYDLTENSGFYFSHYGYYEVENVVVPEREMSFYDMKDMSEIHMIYKGILLDGVKNEFTDSSKYILVNQNLIEKYFQKDSIKGYSFFCHNYQEYINAKNTIEKMGYMVKSFDSIDEIEKFVETLYYLQYAMIIIAAFVGCIGLNYVYTGYLQSRKKEVALLKCNGLENQNIVNMFYKEFLMINCICLIIFLLISIVTKINIVHICLFELILIITIYFVIHKLIKKNNPVNVFRNE